MLFTDVETEGKNKVMIENQKNMVQHIVKLKKSFMKLRN